MEKTEEELRNLNVPFHRALVADGNQFFNRPGPRLVETLEILAEMLHPDHFDFGHRGKQWRHWTRVGV
jgi:iron complex transport system substrate-binding protein